MNNENKVTLYFVRHGETQYNVERRMQGFCDSPLTEKGISQAKSLGEGLSDIHFTASYSSDSQRVLDTAKYAIGEKNIPLMIDKRLKEMNFGVLESLLESEIPNLYGNVLETLFSLDVNACAPEGESYAQLFTRTQSAIKEIIEKHASEGGNILIFSHGVTIGNYMIQITNSKEFAVHENCSVSVVSYKNGQPKVEKIADTSFRDRGSVQLNKSSLIN
ncbi:histidine phosphatase family protein [Metabacillus litoralis]|uniref:histidine phosphatase family protein n=1 Tax=Metabacillus litoralis TaxID=152268 RepID=UPI00203BA3FF|nr:histidine phosphatase family protein [Metabacillus litoralis]MCM3653686.1 histidine phosphatase family protein [Metabacillus litoralis]